MFSALDISTSALVAQRTRLNAVSGNIANISTLKNEKGEAEPYRARSVIFQTSDETTSSGASGVKVDEIVINQGEPQYRWQPGHPLAITEGQWKGHVAYPDIDLTTEMVNALESTRAYEANVGVMEITKNLGQQTLTILG